jgi:6-phosphogluconolactonase
MSGVRRGLGGLLLTSAILAPVAGIAAEATPKSYLLYVAGSYSRNLGKGIYAYRFDPGTGEAAPLGLIQAAVRPSWLTGHPNHNVLYAPKDAATKDAAGVGYGVSAYARDEKTGGLTLLNTVPSMGVSPAQLAITGNGRFLVAANFGDAAGQATVAAFPILPDGSLGQATSSLEQKGEAGGPSVPRDANGLSPTDSHNHCVMLSPDSRFALVCNLGLGKVFIFRLDPKTGVLTQNGAPFDMPTPPGALARPHHMVFQPSGRFAYILDGDMRVVAAAYDAATGRLKTIQMLPIIAEPPPGSAFSGSEIMLSPSGRYLYTSARAVYGTLKSTHEQGALNVFAVDARTGKLSPVQEISTGGQAPRTFAFDPTGAYMLVANQLSDAVTIFAVDRRTGRLTPTGRNLKDSPEPGGFLFEAAE